MYDDKETRRILEEDQKVREEARVVYDRLRRLLAERDRQEQPRRGVKSCRRSGSPSYGSSASR